MNQKSKKHQEIMDFNPWLIRFRVILLLFYFLYFYRGGDVNQKSKKHQEIVNFNPWLNRLGFFIVILVFFLFYGFVIIFELFLIDFNFII